MHWINLSLVDSTFGTPGPRPIRGHQSDGYIVPHKNSEFISKHVHSEEDRCVKTKEKCSNREQWTELALRVHRYDYAQNHGGSRLVWLAELFSRQVQCYKNSEMMWYLVSSNINGQSTVLSAGLVTVLVATFFNVFIGPCNEMTWCIRNSFPTSEKRSNCLVLQGRVSFMTEAQITHKQAYFKLLRGSS